MYFDNIVTAWWLWTKIEIPLNTTDYDNKIYYGIMCDSEYFSKREKIKIIFVEKNNL